MLFKSTEFNGKARSVCLSVYSHTPPITIKDWPFNRPKNLFKKKLSILCNTETFEIDIFLFFNFRQAFNFQLYTDLLVIKQYISRRKNNSELLNIITFLALTFILSKRLNYLRGTIILLQNAFQKKRRYIFKHIRMVLSGSKIDRQKSQNIPIYM